MNVLLKLGTYPKSMHLDDHVVNGDPDTVKMFAYHFVSTNKEYDALVYYNYGLYLNSPSS